MLLKNKSFRDSLSKSSLKYNKYIKGMEFE